ncbi:hypothetical protein BDP55DRAFT_53783 [Colletotrichum godetiae]|uniref:Uncharacterized protein n=1 Tax=Colletotrichum godetiae TaxID=1209918 RepID=A0AAJ0A5P5_9PEZI|nr:uncharacterized protein BDP55DRAFT_53783 [Colletotrichum godetiae]KAK1656976.1 hypothetical protein BDP55DRAFT_53783 [Colletotrichum godetiae]
MAMADVMTRPVCPGLLQPLTEDDLKDSTLLYNSLPRIHSDMQVDVFHVTKLLEIIKKHNNHGKLGLHLLHKHDDIANGTIRLESDLGVVPGTWNRAAQIDSIDIGGIHPVTFRNIPQKNRLVPFEFAKGPPLITLSEQDNDFLVELSSYLDMHSLSDKLALEVTPYGADSQRQECTAEIEVDGVGTVVLPRSMVNSEDFLPTGWFTLIQNGDSDNPPAGQSWAKVVNGSHKVFTNKSVGTPAELVNELSGAGVTRF